MIPATTQLRLFVEQSLDTDGTTTADEAVISVDIGDHAARIRSGSGFRTSLIPAAAKTRATSLARPVAQVLATLLDRAAPLVLAILWYGQRPRFTQPF